MSKVFFGRDDDIINPCWDSVFKSLFTKDTPESRGALKLLLSAIIKRELTVVEVTQNEPSADNLHDRQIRYDIACKVDNGEMVNIEMTVNPDSFEPVRMEYYSGKLFTRQDIKGAGKNYDDLKHTYQISIIVNKKIFADNELLHHFQYFDSGRGIALGGRTHIITMELSKLEPVIEKPISNMTAEERWAVFFKFSTDKDKRQLINEIFEREEGIAMAGETLLTISKDDVEWATALSKYKYEVDMQSKLVTAQREGWNEGEKAGRVVGIQEGKKEGIKEGIKEGTISIARKMLELGFSNEEILLATGYEISEIERL